MLIRKIIEIQRKHHSTDLVEFLVHQNIRKVGPDLSPNGELSQTDVMPRLVFANGDLSQTDAMPQIVFDSPPYCFTNKTPEEAEAETDSNFCDCIEIVIVQTDQSNILR